MHNVKTGLYRKLNFQLNLVALLLNLQVAWESRDVLKFTLHKKYAMTCFWRYPPTF